ncbi:MAG: gliding motility-associated C-terminal domain-containing protein, partial [Bacteroidia bacterium]|nr:gliding motility-associated C-terminal domain-containing protein [Bacteroidia bacterium]
PESGIDANKVFVPRGMFISPDEYEFIIFDRWGVKQFYSQTPKQSWDGMSKGEPAKQDVYVWIVRYKDQYGNVIEKNGTVTLLR